MSYKANQKDPARRGYLLQRRQKKGIKYGTEGRFFLDKYGKITAKMSGPPTTFKRQGTPMKQSNRNALMRQIQRNIHKLTEPQAKTLVHMVMNGEASRHQIYRAIHHVDRLRQARYIGPNPLYKGATALLKFVTAKSKYVKVQFDDITKFFDLGHSWTRFLRKHWKIA